MADQNSSPPQGGHATFVRHEDQNSTLNSSNDQKRHCTYCRKYHRGVCNWAPGIHRLDTTPVAEPAPTPAVRTVATYESGVLTINEALHVPERIRNLAIIAHVDHGKTTIADRLLAKAKQLRNAEVADQCAMDVGKMEMARGITIKATSTALLYGEERLLINLIDCPGHVDFNSEVSAALRITDGALVVVDCVEGICVQTETVLRQALEEGVRPVLFLNKIDRAITEMQLSEEKAYHRFEQTIEQANAIISEYNPSHTISPGDDTVIFGSGRYGWAFTLTQFAEATGLHGVMPKQLWGGRYADKKSQKILSTPTTDAPHRTFVSHVLKPLYRAHALAAEPDCTALQAFISRKGLPPLSPAELAEGPKAASRAMMRKWLPCADAIVSCADQQLPSPLQAQKHRAAGLYEGESTDPACTAMAQCDETGPLMAYITKLVPQNEGKKLLALGRVFSGTARPGMKVSVLDADGRRTDAKISTVSVLLIKEYMGLTEAPPGTLVALGGIDHLGTVTDSPDAAGLKSVSLKVSPVVSVAVSTVKKADTAKLVAALRRLARTDSSLEYVFDEETKEQQLVATGELHLETALHDLQEMLPDGFKLATSPPAVSLRETVTQPGEICLAKSGNKHNRVYARAVPLDEDTIAALGSREVTSDTPEKNRAEVLARCGWDRTEARKKLLKITGTNVLVDCTEGLDMQEVIEHLGAAFDFVCHSGILTNSPVTGVRLELHNGTKWHKERTHRGPAQMETPARRAFLGALLLAEPGLLEPIFDISVQLPDSLADKACSVLKQRRGMITGYTVDRLALVEARVPVEASFGLSGELRKVTAGHAFPQCAFAAWEAMPGDPKDPESLAGAALNKTRARKGLSVDVPTVEDLTDRL